MATGIKVWDASGNLMLDGTKRVGRIKGSTYVSGAPGSSGSLAADLSDGDPVYSFQPDQLLYHISGDTPPPRFTLSSSGVSWQYSPSGGTPYTHTISGWLFVGVK